MTCFCIVRVIFSLRVQPDGMGGEGDDGRRRPGGPFERRRIILCASGDNAYRVFSRETGFPSDVVVAEVFSLTGLSSGFEEDSFCGSSSKLRLPC